MSRCAEGYSYVTTMKLLLAFSLKDEAIVKRKKGHSNEWPFDS